MFFFFNDTATTEIYTLSLHDALPISRLGRAGHGVPARRVGSATQDPLREHALVRRDRPCHRSPAGHARRGTGVCHQPGGDRDPVPPRRGSRRGPWRISMGDRSEESPDRGGTRNESEQVDAKTHRRRVDMRVERVGFSYELGPHIHSASRRLGLYLSVYSLRTEPVTSPQTTATAAASADRPWRIPPAPPR